ncbi:hypothetical protein HanIR_Chr02g0092501 [Helianthus annuus]|nr:hypothetical protein HanIR_Chr02g0092501 [Helianthus annuus]
MLRRGYYPDVVTCTMSHPDHVKQQNMAESSGSVVTESLFHNTWKIEILFYWIKCITMS